MQEAATEIKPSADTIITETGEELLPAPETHSAPDADLLPPTKRTLDDTALMMDVREMAQAAGLAWLSDGFSAIAEKHKLYLYTPDQKSMLVEAWAPTIQKSGIKVSPALKIMMAEAICSGPIVALAYQNRTYRLQVEELQAEIARRDKKLQQDLPLNLYNAVSKASSRQDNKNAWTLDANGLFKYDPDGKSTSYLAVEKRKQRPRIPDDYEQLCKYNGKEKVHEILKLSPDATITT